MVEKKDPEKRIASEELAQAFPDAAKHLKASVHAGAMERKPAPSEEDLTERAIVLPVVLSNEERMAFRKIQYGGEGFRIQKRELREYIDASESIEELLRHLEAEPSEVMELSTLHLWASNSAKHGIYSGHHKLAERMVPLYQRMIDAGYETEYDVVVALKEGSVDQDLLEGIAEIEADLGEFRGHTAVLPRSIERAYQLLARDEENQEKKKKS